MEIKDKFQKFRESLYLLFPKRKDAIMNLLDAISHDGRCCQSVVELSNSPYFKRQYTSITDAIADGLPEAKWEEIRCIIYKTCKTAHAQAPHRFIVDCTGNKRAYAKKLEDRTVTHFPNPAPGNKPICVGHQYSVLSILPNDILENQKHWLVPLSVQRVKSHEKGNEVGMEQIIQSIEEHGLQNDLCISLGDSLYGTEKCRSLVSGQNNLVHIFRLNNKRNIYAMPTSEAKPSGRKKEFGKKINLGDVATHIPFHQEERLSHVNKKGKKLNITIRAWSNMLLRGSRKFRSSEHPMNVVQVCVTTEA